MRRSGELNTLDGPSLSHSTQGVEFGFDEVSLRKAFEFAFRPLSANRPYPPFSWAIATGHTRSAHYERSRKRSGLGSDLVQRLILHSNDRTPPA